ncbi:unnamed protein product, partial [Effrenium voratum]
PNAKFFILFLHSNGEDIGMCHAFVSRLRDLLEVHVLAVEYPGYGICPGTPSEERLHAAARLGFGFMTQVLGAEPADVILFGRSLGTALALALGAEFRVGGLVLVAPFLSLREAVSQFTGIQLAEVLLEELFCNKDRIKSVEAALGGFRARASRGDMNEPCGASGTFPADR